MTREIELQCSKGKPPRAIHQRATALAHLSPAVQRDTVTFPMDLNYIRSWQQSDGESLLQKSYCRQRLNPLPTREHCEAENWNPTEHHSAVTSNLRTHVVRTRCGSGKHLPKQDAEALKDWKGTLKWSWTEAVALSVTKRVRTLLVWSAEA